MISTVVTTEGNTEVLDWRFTKHGSAPQSYVFWVGWIQVGVVSGSKRRGWSAVSTCTHRDWMSSKGEDRAEIAQHFLDRQRVFPVSGFKTREQAATFLMKYNRNLRAADDFSEDEQHTIDQWSKT